MKLQDLVLIFLIIIIPIILIFSYYLNLQADTIKIQMDYDGKLIAATKEAVEAFEINTTEWSNEYQTLANEKKRELKAATNIFIIGLSNKLGISGTAKENILNYIPAIVYTLYDGYYIYSPTYIPKAITDNDGKQIFYYPEAEKQKNGDEFTTSATQWIHEKNGTKNKIYAGVPIFEYESGSRTGIYNGQYFTINTKNAVKEYKHVLKTFVPYSTTINNYTINYTLDNYVRIYGKDKDGNIQANEGYILDNKDSLDVPNNNITGIKYNKCDISTEILTENIPIKNDEGRIEIVNCSYIYNSNGDKRYVDGDSIFVTDSEYNKRDFKAVDANSSLAEFKKVLVKVNDIEYRELYQLLNPENDDAAGWYEYISEQKIYQKFNDISNINGLSEIRIQDDCSAINYCIENYCFNKWIDKKTSLNKESILENREEKIIENINNNLNLSVANYSANSKIEYKLPALTDEEWERVLSNVSMITFLQGMKIGLKVYNNYAIVTSTENNEYVKPESLYYVFKGAENEDEYYHKYPCKSPTGEVEQGYRNVDFKLKNYEDGAYYKHTTYVNKRPTYGIRACFECIVNRNKNNIEDFENSNWTMVHYSTLARERYVQMTRIRLTKTMHIEPEE